MDKLSWPEVALDSIDEAVFGTDLEGRVTFMNRAAQDFTGWPQDQSAGMPLPDVCRFVNGRAWLRSELLQA
jgi:PAS domain S-box-containing protein